MQSLLSLRGLSKSYGGFHALQDLDLEIAPGEFLTILGPSGSGKSTTLLLVAGFERPTRGEIYLEGERVTQRPPYRRPIGMVFQSYALFPHLSVFENVAFALRNLRWKEPEIRARVGELLELVQLTTMADRPPAKLSGGQQQRVALARALASRPSLLLLDEPIAALDKRLREQMLMEFRRIHRQLGTTMVFVTHDQEEAMVMSDRVAVMDKGRLVQVGTPQQLYEAPEAAFVAEFLGDTNLLPVTAAGPGRLRLAGEGPLLAAAHGAPAEASLQLVIRPERIHLGEPPDPAWNRLEGLVEEIVYLGGARKYRLTLPGGQSLTVRQPNHRLAPSAEAGQRIALGWHPEDAQVFASDPD